MAVNPVRTRNVSTKDIRTRPRSSAASGAYDRIWAVVRRIPRGRVATYGQVAALAGYPRAPRVAGYALYALPEGSPLPWHRVVGAGGRLSLGRLSPDGATTQRLRLEREGVRFDARGRVMLDPHRWKPSGSRATASPRRAGVGTGDRVRTAPRRRRESRARRSLEQEP